MFPYLRVLLLALCCATPVRAADITVFAAASLGDAMAEMAREWQTRTGHHVTLTLAGSSTLARQIGAGAPADLFISANSEWMDWLAERGGVDPGSLRDVAANRLALIAHGEGAPDLRDLRSDEDLPSALGPRGRLAIALPEAVPAGIYAKAALTHLGLWQSVTDRLAPTDNVRAALALVALGEAPLGVVYATDAQAEPRVRVIGLFPEASHPVIRYPAAIVSGSTEASVATAFLDWLETDAAQEIFESHGFLPPRPSE
ncbi:molybdate ABC transporter substrate-binding protein [Marivita sp. GX14005]|uniref:molybdate ABC transporter substrate-binding protein n=1 Tax=Marivita sp. GX14005 TaxID=2942276 RepID=UPI002018922B|nr:molybdate ABC transporter substrate-binding protein [Marivita sp. GX14005]MCL3882153.1 molybdate ABC transporter substrate-binding protein [Marivita sp. GX14005]